jgi:hypothetical protein
MGWISLFILMLSLSLSAAELPKLLTKHAIDSIRFLTMDGRYAYVRKKAGVLGMVSSFKSVDFLSEPQSTEFIMSSSRFKNRLVIEAIPNYHTDYDFYKKNKIMVIDWGGIQAKEVGQGINGKLHLLDEWISYFDPVERKVHLKNVVTQKKYEVILSAKANPFFRPEVEMVTSDVVVYTDINEMGHSAVVSFNLLTQKSTILYKSQQSGTRLELCQSEGYLALGEFPYEGVSRSSQIMQVSLSDSTNLSSFTTVYNSVDQDLGNMICLPQSVYFIKTMNQDKKLGIKFTEAVQLDLKTQQVSAKSGLKSVSQLLEMDGRVMIPMRGDFYVLEGRSNLSDDTLRAVPVNNKEELPLDL